MDISKDFYQKYEKNKMIKKNANMFRISTYSSNNDLNGEEFILKPIDGDSINDECNNEVLIVEESVKKKEKVKKKDDKMSLDAAILDFDMTATRKNELISAKFSETFKSVLEDFPISNKKREKEQKKINIDLEPLVKNDIESFRDMKHSENSSEERRMTVWAKKMNESSMKSKFKILSIIPQYPHDTRKEFPTKSSLKKNEPIPEKNFNQRPKTSLSFSNSSITSMKLKKPHNEFLKRPTSTKSDCGYHVSNLLFDGYEKRIKKDQFDDKIEFEEEEISDANYISPSFRIKKYNLSDNQELEMAKKDLFKRYSVFKEPLNQRPKSNRAIRFSSSSRLNFTPSSIKTF